MINVEKIKKYMIILVISLIQILYFIFTEGIPREATAAYSILINFMYFKYLALILFVLEMSNVVKYFDRYIIILRYNEINRLLNDIIISTSKAIGKVIITINVTPIIISIMLGNYYNYVQIVLILIFRQILVLSVLSIIYWVLYMFLRNVSVINIIILLTIYLPYVIIRTLCRSGTLTPIDMVVIGNVSWNTIILQTNACLAIIFVSIYLLKSKGNRFLKKDFIRRI